MANVSDQKIVFLHNVAADYRLSFFNELKKNLKQKIDVWIYNDQAVNKSLRFFSYIKWPLRFSFSVLWSLLNTDFDILILAGSHTHEIFFCWLIAKLRKKKIIFWTETWLWGEMDLKNRFFMFIICFIAKHSDRVVYPGVKVNELYLSLGIKDSHQFFAPNASIKGSLVQSKKKLNRFSFGFFGRIMPRKGLHLLLTAFKKLPNKYTLFAAGEIIDINYYKKIRSLVKELKNVYFLDKFGSNKKQIEFFNKFSTFIYPSTSLFGMAEPWGLALNEAMQAGKILISTSSVAAAYDLIEHGKNGFLIKDGDVIALKNAIRASTKLNYELVNKINKRKLKEYSYKNMAKGFVSAIKSLI